MVNRDMGRLIDVDVALDLKNKDMNWVYDLEDLEEYLAGVPTVDAEPVIHCKDCKYAHMTYGGYCKYCDVFPELEEVYFPGDFYCRFAEKKEEK